MIYNLQILKRLNRSFLNLNFVFFDKRLSTVARKMEIKHFAEGSLKPSVKENVTYLYSMRFCPYAHRAHLVLNAKNVEYEPIYINLSAKPKWYLELFPAGRVPALLYKGEFLYESLLLADFLNEEFPQNPLYPPSPLNKLKDKILIESFGKISTAFYKTAMVEFNDENFGDLISGLAEFEKELGKRATRYFGGNERPLMVDYMIWPWFERILALSVLYGDSAKFPEEKFPNLNKWIAEMKNDASVLKHYLTPEQHGKHFRLRKSQDPGAFDGVY